MRILSSILLVVFVSLTSASEMYELGSRHVSGGSGPGTDDYNQPYDFSLLQNGYSNHANRWVCDDFTLDHPNMIVDLWVWMIYTGETPSTYNLVFSEDDLGDSDPNTNTDVWAGSVPCTNSFTGDSNWGYDIYQTYCDIPGVLLMDSTHYYLETNAGVVDNCFILVGPNMIGDLCWYDDGSGVWVRVDVYFGEETDMFFVLGELMALESETWGNIKTLF